MRFKAGITDKRMALQISEEAYDAECDALNCPTPKAERQTPGAFAIRKHPAREEYRLCANPERERAIPHVRASHRDDWINATDITEDEWDPIFTERVNGDRVLLKRTLNEIDRLTSKLSRMGIDEALDELIAER